MSTFLSKDVLAGLEDAHKISIKKKNRLCVEFNKTRYPVMVLKQNGFSLEAEIAPEIRGLVDLYDGNKHLLQCLIVASKEENGIVHFEYKRKTATTTDPPKDFYQEKKLAGLISQSL